MIRTVCPQCGTPLKAPDEYAGKVPLCPKCNAPVPAKDPGSSAVVNEILGLKEVPPPAPEPAPEPASAPAPPAQPPPAPGTRLRRRFGPWLVPAVSGLVLVIAVVWMVAYAGQRRVEVRVRFAVEHANNALRDITDLEKSAEAIAAPVEQALFDATFKGMDYNAAVQYTMARDKYQRALELAQERQTRLDELVASFAAAKVPAELRAVKEKVDAKATALRKVLASDPMVKGVAGDLPWQGQMVARGDYDRRFREEMLQRGNTWDTDGRHWLTRDEYYRKQGLRLYPPDGKYYPLDVYNKLIQRDAELAKEQAADTAEKARQAEIVRQEREARLAAERAQLEAAKLAMQQRYPLSAPDWVLDNFQPEAGNPDTGEWQPAKDAGDAPVDVAAVDRDGGKALRITVGAGARNRGAIKRPIFYDWSNREKVTLQVDAGNVEDAQVALALTTDVYYETRSQRLTVGTNLITFNLTGKGFDSTGSGKGPFNAVINEPTRVLWLYLVFIAPSGGDFHVRNIHVTR